MGWLLHYIIFNLLAAVAKPTRLTGVLTPNPTASLSMGRCRVRISVSGEHRSFEAPQGGSNRQGLPGKTSCSSPSWSGQCHSSPFTGLWHNERERDHSSLPCCCVMALDSPARAEAKPQPATRTCLLTDRYAQHDSTCRGEEMLPCHGMRTAKPSEGNSEACPALPPAQQSVPAGQPAALHWRGCTST